MTSDENGDGVLSMEEARIYCKKAMNDRYPENVFSDEEFRGGYAKIDTDASGTIDFKELITVIALNLKRQKMLIE